MARKFEDQEGPYEFERPVHGSSKLSSVAAGVAGFAIAAGMLSGVAFAVSASPQNVPGQQTSEVVADPAVEQVSDDAQAEDLTSEMPSDSLDQGQVTEPAAQDQAREISTPTTVITPTFSSSDDDGDDDGDDHDGVEQEDEHHTEDSAFESEDSEDD